MDFDSLSQEQQILVVMRKVLTGIARETAPEAGMIHPLSKQTIEDMRMCLGLIASREYKLAQANGVTTARPRFSDEQKTSQVVSLDKLRKTKH